MCFPEGEIPRRQSRNSRVYKEKYLQVKWYSQYVRCLNRGREESVGDDDVSIVRARK